MTLRGVMGLLFLKPWWSTSRPLCNISWKKQTSAINHSKKSCIQNDMINMEGGEFWRVNYFNKTQSIFFWKKQLQKDCDCKVRWSKCSCHNQLLSFKCRKMTNEPLRAAILYLELKKREMNLQGKRSQAFLHVDLFQVKVMWIYWRNIFCKVFILVTLQTCCGNLVRTSLC